MKTTASHTPGPWAITDKGEAAPNTFWISATDGMKVCTVESYPSRTTGRADARRICAAVNAFDGVWIEAIEDLKPGRLSKLFQLQTEMRQALESAHPLLIEFGEYIGNDGGRCEAVLKVRRALDKAEELNATDQQPSTCNL